MARPRVQSSAPPKKQNIKKKQKPKNYAVQTDLLSLTLNIRYKDLNKQTKTTEAGSEFFKKAKETHHQIRDITIIYKLHAQFDKKIKREIVPASAFVNVSDALKVSASNWAEWLVSSVFWFSCKFSL